MHYFTSVTANYIPKARVLAQSVKTHNPDGVFHLVLSDQPPEGFDMANEPFDRLILIQDLEISDLDAWIFKHSVVELCTAVKGAAFLKIFEDSGAEKVIYFDPDIAVLHSLAELSRILDAHSVVLTPHQLVPETLDEAIVDNEICSLKHGVYNLGFLAVRRSAEGLRFLQWWRDRLLKYCYADIPNGLFTDQRWVDLAPCFFDEIHILRDKCYNIATWNLTHRRVEADEGGKLRVEGEPVKFYHFSGFDSGAQELMLKKYGSGNKPLFALRQWYIRELEKAGQEELGSLPCVYSFYSNGEPITEIQRRLYRSRQDLIRAFPRPAQVTEDKNCYYYWFKETAPRECLEDDRILTDKEQQLETILNSKSWKLTRPLRELMAFFRGTRMYQKLRS